MVRNRALVLMTILAGCGTPVAADDEATRHALFGKVTYQLSCAVCHGASARGEGEMAEHLAVPAPDLTGLARRNGGAFPTEYVTKVIAGGSAVTAHGGQMPAWGLIFLKDLEDRTQDTSRDDAALVQRRIEDLVVYLRSIQDDAQ